MICDLAEGEERQGINDYNLSGVEPDPTLTHVFEDFNPEKRTGGEWATDTLQL